MAGPPLPASAWWPALAGAAICAGLVVLDVVSGSDRIISSTVVIAPFLTAVRGTTRQTAAVGALALTACVLSGVWNDNFGTVEYLLRLAVVAAGASFAVLAARTRTRLDASRARAALIASVGDIAVESATLDETLERLGDAIVPAFADLLVVDVVRGGAPQRRLADETVPQLADWCSVHLLAPSGEIRSVAVAHVDPAMLEFAREYRERWPVSPDEPTGPAAVIRDGGSERMEIPDRLLVESVRDPEQLALLRTLGLRSVMTVPIVAGGAPIGALSFVSAESRRTLGAADLALAQELGRRAGTATEHAWLYEERTRIARAADRAVAGQHARDPRLGLGCPVPARGGGEPRGRRLLRRLRRARRLDARRRRRDRPRGGGRRTDRRRPLDDALLDRAGMALCTVACLVLRETPGGAEVDVVCAGHPRPLLVCDGRVQALGRWGALLGAFPGERWTATTVAIGPGDLVVLYTDGVLDAQGTDHRFGDERLEEALRGCRTAERAVGAIDAALSAFEAGEQADDTAVLAIQRMPAAVPLVRAPSAAR